MLKIRDTNYVDIINKSTDYGHFKVLVLNFN
jgi:hypothetical protein